MFGEAVQSHARQFRPSRLHRPVSAGRHKHASLANVVKHNVVTYCCCCCCCYWVPLSSAKEGTKRQSKHPYGCYCQYLLSLSLLLLLSLSRLFACFRCSCSFESLARLTNGGPCLANCYCHCHCYCCCCCCYCYCHYCCCCCCCCNCYCHVLPSWPWRPPSGFDIYNFGNSASLSLACWFACVSFCVVVIVLLLLLLLFAQCVRFARIYVSTFSIL